MNEEKLQVLHAITDLIKAHNPDGKPDLLLCEDDCNLCIQVRRLGVKYEELIETERHHRKTRVIMRKGKDATISDVKYLLEDVGMPSTSVANLLGMGRTKFANRCLEWGISKQKREG